MASAGYDDTAWASGPAQLGYGDGDEVTTLIAGSSPLAVTAYFRHDFEGTDAAASALVLDVVRDDGVAVYLNSVKLVRADLPIGPLAPDTLATGYVWGAAESTAQTYEVDAGALVPGSNTLAVEVHQASGSGDLSFDVALAARP
jgi:hypothetical protein